MVTNTNTIINPWAMVIHFDNASSACTTVMCPTRLKSLALHAIFFIFINIGVIYDIESLQVN